MLQRSTINDVLQDVLYLVVCMNVYFMYDLHVYDWARTTSFLMLIFTNSLFYLKKFVSNAVIHLSKMYLLIDGLKLENRTLK